MEAKEMLNGNTIEKKERKVGVDLLRFICAFLVVCVHQYFFGERYLLVLARIAVPIFFMITGYFFVNASKEKQIKQIKRIGWLTVFSTIFYFVYNIVKALIKGSLVRYLNSVVFIVKNLILFVFLNENIIMHHLWFLSTMLCSLVFIYLLSNKINKKIAFVSSLCLIVVGVVINFIVEYFTRQWIPCYTRNFIFWGIPFSLIGACLNDKRFIIKNKLAIWLIIVFVIFSLIENYLFLLIDVRLELYISTIFLSIVVFSFCLNTPFENGFFKKIAFLGKKYSLMIYIIHIAFIDLVELVLAYLNASSSSGWLIVICKGVSAIAPVFTFIFSLLFAMLWEFIVDKIKLGIEKNKLKKIQAQNEVEPTDKI